MSRDRAPLGLLFAVAATIVVLLAVVAGLGAILLTVDLDTADKAASVVGTAVATLVAVIAVTGWWRRAGSRPDEPVDRMRVHLGRRAALPLLGEVGARALALRVHPAIEGDEPAPLVEPGRQRRLFGRAAGHPAADERADLPTFVPRDRQPEVEQWMRRAATTGGMLVLVGDSAVGKSRLLYETARRILGDFRVLAPSLGDGDLVNEVARAGLPLPKLVVWLDELQRFLPGPFLTEGSTPVTATAVRALLDASTPVVILATCWPEHLRELRAGEGEPVRAADPATPGRSRVGQPPETDRPPPTRRDRYSGAVDVLRPGREIAIGTFSPAERRAAEELAPRDRRLEVALEYRDFNVTEVLAGAPELVRRYERGTAEARAVVEAAVDATRIGVESPLTAEALREAARGYLDRAEPDDGWFAPALAELTRLDRSTSLLIPVTDEDRRAVLGYRVADYVRQQVANERRRARVRDSLWRALLAHVDDLADIRRLENEADLRSLYCYSERLTRVAAAAGDEEAAATMQMYESYLAGTIEDLPTELHERRATALAGVGDLALLRRLADGGDRHALGELCALLVARGDDRALRQRPEDTATDRLAELLVDRGVVGELRRVADGSPQVSDARELLAQVLESRGLLDELDARAAAGDLWAGANHVAILAARGDWAQIRRRADRGDLAAPAEMAAHLTMRADLDALREIVAANRVAWARDALAGMLADRGALDELRSRADGGDEEMQVRLALALTTRGCWDELRDRADSGDGPARREYVGALVRRGDVDALRHRAAAGEAEAVRWLAHVLLVQGREDERRALAVPGTAFAREYADNLARRGDAEELTERARAGDTDAGEALADLLARRGDAEALAALADAVVPARDRLARLRAERLPDANLARELREVAGTDAEAQRRLAAALLARGDLDELRFLAATERGPHPTMEYRRGERFSEFRSASGPAGSHFTQALVDALCARGDVAELHRLAGSDEVDTRVVRRGLAELLVQRRDWPRLAALAAEDQYPAAAALAEVHAINGDIDALVALAGTSDAGGAELAEVLLAREDVAGLRALADAELAAADRPNQPLGEVHAALLADRHDIDALAERAARGDEACARRLAWLLSARGDVERLRAAADGNDTVRAHYVEVLLARGDLAGFEELVRTGDAEARARARQRMEITADVEGLRRLAEGSGTDAARALVRVLWQRGDLDALRTRVDSGDRVAAPYLHDMLRARGKVAELAARAEAGDAGAAERLVPLLSLRGEVEGLCREIDAGTYGADAQLAILLDERGEHERAANLRRYGMTPGRPASLAAIATARVPLPVDSALTA